MENHVPRIVYLSLTETRRKYTQKSLIIVLCRQNLSKEDKDLAVNT